MKFIFIPNVVDSKSKTCLIDKMLMNEYCSSIMVMANNTRVKGRLWRIFFICLNIQIVRICALKYSTRRQGECIKEQ